MGMFFSMAALGAAQAATTARSGAEARVTASRAAADVGHVQHDVERLFMITEALWTMLKEQHGYTDEQLAACVTQIDMRDGKLDGKVAADGVKTCPACNRPLSKRHPFCLYCGHTFQPLFDR